MDQRIRRLITMGAVALICLVLVTAPVPAQQHDPLQAAANALSAHKVSSLRVRGFGATFSAGRRVPMISYESDISLTPQGFLKAARAANATVRDVPMGTEVSFTAGGRTFVGLINARNEVDRVHTWVDDQGTGDAMVETLFRDYERTPSGVLFPRHITQSRGGHPSLDVWVSAVSVTKSGVASAAP
jgi:hypothetical protein